MKQSEKESLLNDLSAGISLLESTKRPTPPTIERSVTLLKKVQVACQTIPITPVDEFGTPIQPPPPGPEEPPITPAPPDPDPGGGVTPPPPTTITTTFSSVADFNTTQGYRGWYYLEQDGTQMTYNTTNVRWEGRQAFQSIWNVGQHPGATLGSMRRWVAQATGSIAISGSVSDQSPGGSSGITFRMLKNGSSIYSQAMPDGGSLSPTFTGSVVSGDTIDFLVFDPLGDIGQDGTLVNMTVSLTTQGTGGTPTQTSLPFTLNGTAPQDAILTLNMNKPGNADTCTLAVTGVNLAATYGLLYFNGTSNSVTLWPTVPANSGVSATVQLAVPVAYVFNGQNTLRFTHDSGAGYTVTACTVSFTTVTPPTPPATQTTLPFILNGSVLPEDGLLTINVSKPANPDTATLTVTGTDLAEADGTLSINGNSNITIWPVNAANNGAVRTVTLSTSNGITPNLFNNGTNTLRFTHTSGDGFIVSAVSVNITAQPVTPPVSGGAWPNEPATTTLATEWSFALPFPTGWADEYNGSSLMSLVTNQNGPQSPPSALQGFFPIGHPGGNGVGNFSYNMSGKRSMYVGMWVKHSSPFQQHPDGDKICYYTAQNGNQHPGYTLMRGSRIDYVVQYDGTIDNRQLVPGFPFLGTVIVTSNVSNWVLGQWNRLEVYLRESTTTTSQDGIVRWWTNGQLCNSFTNVNTAQFGGYTGVHINPVYGGGTQVTKTENDFIWYDHVRITGGS